MSPRIYQVFWSASAERDLGAIIDYIAIEKKESAIQVLQKIKRVTSTLKTLPDRGRIVPELKEQGILFYHELIIKPWRVFYRISDKNVYVLAVIDSHRNVEDMLLERLTR